MLKRLTLLTETLVHLKPRQIVGQIWNRLHRRSLVPVTAPIVSHQKQIECTIAKTSCLKDNQFTFLNISDCFTGWGTMTHGALWAYNLNYMDWLEQEDIEEEECLKWIDRFIEELPTNHVGLAPYPIALRVINWAKFFSKHPDSLNQSRRDSMYAQTMLLSRSLEYHVLGNHLLEDAYALFIASLFFNDKCLYHKAVTLLLGQLKEQILPDGAHYEQSPMYHCIMLDRLLDCINFAKGTPLFDGQENVTSQLTRYAQLMLGHLASIIWADGSIPLFNDSALGIAPTSEKLFEYACCLGLSWTAMPLRECGYRHLAVGNLEAIVDIGNIMASYQPGHSHADTFSYELRMDGQPLIVDTGISTYNKNERRQYERSTTAHNTVSIGRRDSSRVWGGFRVGRRAKVTLMKDEPLNISARHDGFGTDFLCMRSFSMNSGGFRIEDRITGKTKANATSYIHLAPGIAATFDGKGTVKAGSATITFEGHHSIEITDNHVSSRYNEQLPSKVIAVHFHTFLVIFIK